MQRDLGAGLSPPPPISSETGPLLSLPPFAASFFGNFHHVREIWRKRVGVEPKLQTPNSRRMMTLQLPPNSNWSQSESNSRAAAPLPPSEVQLLRTLPGGGQFLAQLSVGRPSLGHSNSFYYAWLPYSLRASIRAVSGTDSA
jgi:hypothetical protein